ncbi:5-hydroxytryptamine receptor 1D-like [Glandiceps talaboti]
MVILYYKIFRTAQRRARTIGPIATVASVLQVQPGDVNVENVEEHSSPTTSRRHIPAKDTRRNERSQISIAKERKAARTLAIVMGVFILCWLPFFTVNIILGVCRDCILSDTLFSFVTWLGWCNSALNPVIYTVFNKEFRNAFRKILTGGRGNLIVPDR